MQQRFFIADIIVCSTCFGHHYAHHQELKMTSQHAAFKMADMHYYGNVMTTTRWLLYSTSSTVQS